MVCILGIMPSSMLHFFWPSTCSQLHKILTCLYRHAYIVHVHVSTFSYYAILITVVAPLEWDSGALSCCGDFLKPLYTCSNCMQKQDGKVVESSSASIVMPKASCMQLLCKTPGICIWLKLLSLERRLLAAGIIMSVCAQTYLHTLE